MKKILTLLCVMALPYLNASAYDFEVNGIFFTVTSFKPTVLTSYPSGKKCLFPNFYFKFTCLSNIISALLPFKYPIKLATLIRGGILTSI
mgnify:CR=1 FL=1